MSLAKEFIIKPDTLKGIAVNAAVKEVVVDDYGLRRE